MIVDILTFIRRINFMFIIFGISAFISRMNFRFNLVEHQTSFASNLIMCSLKFHAQLSLKGFIASGPVHLF